MFLCSWYESNRDIACLTPWLDSLISTSEPTVASFLRDFAETLKKFVFCQDPTESMLDGTYIEGYRRFSGTKKFLEEQMEKLREEINSKNADIENLKSNVAELQYV